MRGVTPDERVVAATKRQPEYGKPVGDYINALVSKGRMTRGEQKAREWAKSFDAVEKKFAVERWVLLALWGMETDYGAAKDRWDVFRSLSTLAYVKYRAPLFPQRAVRGDAHHAGRPHSARADGVVMGGRHGPDAVHAVELR